MPLTASDDARTREFLATLEPRPQRPRNPNAPAERFFAGLQRNSLTSSGGFAGASIDRMTEEWRPGTIGPNQLFRMGGKLLRERARQLVLDNPLAKSAVDAYIANVIECGITPHPRYESRDSRKAWIDAWQIWGGLSPVATSEADADGEESIYDLQALWLEEIIVGGGCLVHYIEKPRRGRSIPLALELIPEERFAEHLDHFGGNAKTANRVVNGIELDSLGNAVAYHVLVTHPNDLNFDAQRTMRISINDADYTFFKRRAGQKRGHTLLHSAILWLYALGLYTDNEMQNSTIKSVWAYMIKTGDQSDFEYPDLMDSSPETGTTDIYGNPLEKLEPQMIFRGHPGDEIEAVGPNVPGSDSEPWIRLIQRSISVGIGQSYEETVRDYSKGSFSSVRAAMNSDRKRYRRLQKFSVRRFCNPTYKRFTMGAAREGLQGFPRQSEIVANLNEWLNISSSTPGWESVNPREDAQAADIGIANGTRTHASVIEPRGDDLEEHYDQLALEKQEREERGLEFPPAPPAAPDNEPSQAQQEADDAA